MHGPVGDKQTDSVCVVFMSNSQILVVVIQTSGICLRKRKHFTRTLRHEHNICVCVCVLTSPQIVKIIYGRW
jgi:hypothetical protein